MSKSSGSRKSNNGGKRNSFLECPYCGAELRNVKTDTVCFCCGRNLKIGSSPKSNMAIANNFIPEPLYLPRGSIRAFATFLIAVSSWMLIFKNKEIPEYIFGLLLAIVGYYFGAAGRAGSQKESQTTILENTSATGNSFISLALAIRFFLIAGFLISGIFAIKKGVLFNSNYIQFFGVFTGFIAGYFFARIFEKTKGRVIYNAINHAKGGAVIAAAFILAIMMMSGYYLEYPHLSLFLSAFISFYFGSKS